MKEKIIHLLVCITITAAALTLLGKAFLLLLGSVCAITQGIRLYAATGCLLALIFALGNILHTLFSISFDALQDLLSLIFPNKTPDDAQNPEQGS